MRSGKFIGLLVLCPFILIFIFQLAICSLSFEVVAPYVHSLASDGNLEPFTRAFYSSIQLAMFVSALILGVLILIGYFLREKLLAYINCVANSLREDRKRVMHSLESVCSPSSFFLLALIMVFALILRLSFINQAIRYDESFSFLSYANKNLVLALANYSEPNNHLLNTLLMKVSSSIFGMSEWAIRLPSLIFGMLLIPTGYVLGSLVYKEREGLLFATLIAMNSFILEFSVLGRGYTAVCFFTLIVCICCWLLKAMPDNRFLFFVFAVTAALGAYAVPIMVYPVAGACLFLLLHFSRELGFRIAVKKLFLLCSAIAATVFILYAPVLLISGVDSLIYHEHFVQYAVLDLAASIPSSLFRSFWELWLRDLDVFFAILFLLFTLVFAAIDRRFLALFSCMLIGALGLVLLQRVNPFARVWLYLLVLYLLCVARGASLVFELVAPNKSQILAVCFIFLFSVSSAISIFSNGSIRDSQQTGAFDSASEVMQKLDSELEAGDIIAADAPLDYTLKYYAAKRGFDFTYFDMRKGLPPKSNSLFIVKSRVEGFKSAGMSAFEKSILDRQKTKDLQAYRNEELSGDNYSVYAF